jgi:hypothetical protein
LTNYLSMWKRYLSPTPANVARIMLIIKGGLAIFIGSEIATHDYRMATYGAIVGFILQELANFLTEKPKDDAN